jgi:aspartyl-tRNA(Asn)/glutamyl-tRNA(Gln) amidotransferase subunit C
MAERPPPGLSKRRIGVRGVTLSLDQVRHIAELAKLALTDKEVERFAEQLSAILGYAEALNRLDTDAIPPTAQVLALSGGVRPDTVQPSLSVDEVLVNAPRRRDGFFEVQPILE